MQHLGEGLCRGPEVKAFAGCIVVGGNEAAEAAARQGSKIGFARDEAPHAADRILDAAFLPRRVRIAEEGLDREAVQGQVTSELSAVVEGDGLAQALRQLCKQANEMTGDAPGELAGEADAQQQARGALVHGQHGLTVF